jgi:hypothetical protein
MQNLDRGSASLEFIVATVALLVPLVALSVTTSDIASATFAATTASRQGVRAFTRSESVAQGNSQISAIAQLAMEDHGLTDVDWSVDINCSAHSCRQRGSIVQVTVSVEIPLRFIPALPGITTAPAVTVSRSATARVSITSVNR